MVDLDFRTKELVFERDLNVKGQSLLIGAYVDVRTSNKNDGDRPD